MLMPSTQPSPDACPVDLDHLKRMTFGEAALEREVLQLFLKQTSRLLIELAEEPTQAGALSHTLKGSARAIGAFRLADHADALEQAARQGHDRSEAFAALREAAAEAQAAVEALLRRT
jgi:HPt (histidine-containing phosphotransfer) domain-containing protein